MNLSHRTSVAFIPAVALLLFGLGVDTSIADSPEPMPPLPWSDEEPMAPRVTKNSRATQLRKRPSVSNAFALPADGFASSSNSPETSSDIADKLSLSRATSQTKKQPSHTLLASKIDNESIAQLERIAKEAKSIHALGRLIKRCQTMLTTDLDQGNLSAEARRTVNRIASWAYIRRGQAREHSSTTYNKAAIADYTAAIVFDPYQVDAYLNRGILLAELGTLSTQRRALVDFSQVIELEPDHLIALRNRATLYLELKEPQKSLRDTARAIAIWEQQEKRSRRLIVALHELSGNASLQLARYEEAIQAYGQALDYHPQSASVRLRRGALLAMQENYRLAINDLIASLDSPSVTQNEAIEAYRCLAWLLATCPKDQLRNTSVAIEAANRALQLSSKRTPQLLETVAVAYASAGDFAKAVEYQQKVVLATSAAKQHLAKQRLKQFEQGLFVGRAPRTLAREKDVKKLRQATYNQTGTYY